MMKKFVLFMAGAAAVLVILVNLVPLFVLAVTLWLSYLVFREFLKAGSTGGKIMWALVGMMLLSASISNIPSIMAIVAAIVLYFIYRSWNGQKKAASVEQRDPFSNFEKEWERLNKN